MSKVTFGWTKAGACKILGEDAARIQILLPGRKKAQWVSKTHQRPSRPLQPIPQTLRLIKKAKFDQDCGCTATLEVENKTVQAFNVYGSLNKYVKSGVKIGLDDTPYKRRVFLKENGFVRALGSRRVASNVGEVLFSFQRKGYRIMTEAAPKAAKVEAAPVAEKKEEALVS